MKNLTIKDVPDETLLEFEKLKTSTGIKKTARQVIAWLIEKSQQKNTDGTEQPISQTPEYRKLFLEFEKSNNQVTNLMAELTEMSERLTVVQQSLSDAVVIHPEFICKPKGKLIEIMENVKPTFYKDGFTLNTDQACYQNEFAIYSMRYFLENNYPKFLK